METHGYDTSIGYSQGFGREMAPGWIDFCALLSGYSPRPREGGFRYLELGSGQGANLCVLAAAHPEGEFVGIDFLPEHVEHAGRLAAAQGLENVRFLAADFVDLAARWPSELGAFDYVALHGVYSWVSDPVRVALVECLRHATRAGALVYAGYNTLPGWLGSIPFQHIARSLKAATGEPGPDAIGRAIALFDGLHAAGVQTFEFLPALKVRVDSLKAKDAAYLVHEYLHEGWKPQWHSELAGELAVAGLAFVGSATIAETLLPGVLPPAMRGPILAMPDPALRQDLQDFVINQAFRRDLFVRGAHTGGERDLAAIGHTPVFLARRPDETTELAIAAPFGEVRLQPPAFGEIVDALASGPRTIDELALLPGNAGRGIEPLLQVVIALLHAGTLALNASSEPDRA